MGSGEISLSLDSLVINNFNKLQIKYYNLFVSNEYLQFELDIWAKPGSKVEKSVIGENGELILYIKERPVEGAANKGLIKVLSKLLSTPKSSIELKRGDKSKFKRFSFQLTFTDRKNFDYYLEQISNLAGK